MSKRQSARRQRVPVGSIRTAGRGSLPKRQVRRRMAVPVRLTQTVGGAKCRSGKCAKLPGGSCSFDSDCGAAGKCRSSKCAGKVGRLVTRALASAVGCGWVCGSAAAGQVDVAALDAKADAAQPADLAQAQPADDGAVPRGDLRAVTFNTHLFLIWSVTQGRCGPTEFRTGSVCAGVC